MIDEIEMKILFDAEIQDHRLTRWNSETYEQLRSKTNSDVLDTRKWLHTRPGAPIKPFVNYVLIHSMVWGTC